MVRARSPFSSEFGVVTDLRSKLQMPAQTRLVVHQLSLSPETPGQPIRTGRSPRHKAAPHNNGRRRTGLSGRPRAPSERLLGPPLNGSPSVATARFTTQPSAPPTVSANHRARAFNSNQKQYTPSASGIGSSEFFDAPLLALQKLLFESPKVWHDVA